MPEPMVTMKVRRLSEQVSVIDIQGEVNNFAEEALMDAYTRASTGGLSTLILNFSEMNYMNSSGIGLLVTLLIRTTRQKQTLLACNLSEHYQHIFELTRLNDAIRVFPDEAHAVAAAGIQPARNAA